MSRETTAAERTVQNIVDLITNNEMKAGDKLPSEREFSEILGVGRPTVREALKIADAFGIVDIRQYDGIYVAGIEAERLSIPFKVRMGMGQFDLSQLFEMRRIFEVEIMKLAACHITPEQLDYLGSILEKENIDDAEQFAESDSEFHATIYRSTGNEFLVIIMQIVNELSSLSRRITGRFIDTRRIVHADHLSILDALKSKNADDCERAMLQHIDHIQKIIELDTKVYESVFQQQLKALTKTSFNEKNADK